MTVTSIDVDGRRLRLSNPDKVLWPGTGMTKRGLLDYYLRLMPVILPHIRRRPLTLGRWPDGVEEVGWLQTSCHHHPEWMATHPVPRQRPGRGPGRDYCVVDEPAGLVWLANLATIELHPLLARSPAVDQPDVVVFDLDPGEGTTILTCAQVALWLREDLAAQGLAGYPKTSGALGLHVYVPLGPGHTYAQTKGFARAVAARLAGAHADLVVDKMDRSLRRGRVLIDWSQNDQNKSTVAPYSLRATRWPLVSTPVRWEEIEAALCHDDARALYFLADTLADRLEDHDDLFGPVLAGSQSLPASA